MKRNHNVTEESFLSPAARREKMSRKIGGESLRNRDVVNEDRLSALPDDLILRISSPLRTEYVIYTSFLSKRWRYLWKMLQRREGFLLAAAVRPARLSSALHGRGRGLGLGFGLELGLGSPAQ
ncbi:hypothetical protein F2Q69_00005442 [Brassica cretica]|uniref:F-box domain-containing protein n=1 Tax=Brassica cretica TaxID=69181 RepID=A0A8S9PKU5_BRACR|nr:hypothetical protein F2Q69_00005442 [Brassica cretica]